MCLGALHVEGVGTEAFSQPMIWTLCCHDPNTTVLSLPVSRLEGVKDVSGSHATPLSHTMREKERMLPSSLLDYNYITN